MVSRKNWTHSEILNFFRSKQVVFYLLVCEIPECVFWVVENIASLPSFVVFSLDYISFRKIPTIEPKSSDLRLNKKFSFTQFLDLQN